MTEGLGIAAALKAGGLDVDGRCGACGETLRLVAYRFEVPATRVFFWVHWRPVGAGEAAPGLGAGERVCAICVQGAKARIDAAMGGAVEGATEAAFLAAWRVRSLYEVKRFLRLGKVAREPSECMDVELYWLATRGDLMGCA